MDALRVCKDYLPAKLAAFQAEYDKAIGSKGARDANLLINEARQWESSGQYATAVSCYMKVRFILYRVISYNDLCIIILRITLVK